MQDGHGTTDSSFGDQLIKLDKGKIRYNLVPPEAIEILATIYDVGATKYYEESWREVDLPRWEAAMLRHWVAHKKGEELDSESNRPHLWHMAWNAMTMAIVADMQKKTVTPVPTNKDWFANMTEKLHSNDKIKVTSI